MPRNAQTVSLDIGAHETPVFSSHAVTGLAGGSGDNVEDDGAFHAPPANAQSFAVHVQFTATLDENETLSLALNAQDATDIGGTGAADFQTDNTVVPTVVATGGSGGSTETGVFKARYQDIRAHRGFIRSQTTGDLSRGATDTFSYSVTHVYGGVDTLPAA
jgi:hypothetical protein